MMHSDSRGVFPPLALLVAVLLAPIGISPVAAQTVSPREGAQLNYIHVPFQWTPDGSAVQYQLHVAEAAGDASPFGPVRPWSIA
jgi:hypothetical protein